MGRALRRQSGRETLVGGHSLASMSSSPLSAMIAVLVGAHRRRALRAGKAVCGGGGRIAGRPAAVWCVGVLKVPDTRLSMVRVARVRRCVVRRVCVVWCGVRWCCCAKVDGRPAISESRPSKFLEASARTTGLCHFIEISLSALASAAFLPPLLLLSAVRQASRPDVESHFTATRPSPASIRPNIPGAMTLHVDSHRHSTHPAEPGLGLPMEVSGERPTKKIKTSSARGRQPDTESDVTWVRRHPLGVRPSGNALTSSINAKDSAGLFARLPDELLMQLLETLNVPHLLRLGGTCRALHAFTRSEELWRALFIE